jgi:hypothetical protein
MCRANHCGWYQILDPMIAMMAGTRVSRTTKASRNTPAAKLKPIALMVGSLVNMKATKMENMISAAAVTTRADSPVPRCTARRARIEHLVNGFVDFLIRNRHYAVMASTDPAAKRDKLDAEAMTMRRRALTLLFGDNPTGAERLSFSAVFFLPECLPELTDLTDDELREALLMTMLRMLRV